MTWRTAEIVPSEDLLGPELAALLYRELGRPGGGAVLTVRAATGYFFVVASERRRRGRPDDLAREPLGAIEISTRHGGLDAEQQRYLHDKAEKLQKYFARLMAIEVAVDHVKHAWDIEILVSAEHKHDFVARETGATPEAAMDACVHKIENQLRRYKERVQNHKGDVPQGGTDIA